MKTPIFKGVATALITPFKDGKLDLDAFERLIERQIEAGIDGIVIGGTTGEAATLSNDERYLLFRVAKNAVRGRTKLIFGTGTNDTAVAAKHTEYAERVGCDGVLLVTPYYNKGTREGLARHYESIADGSDVPIILYNVPSRTGVNLDLETLHRLAEHKRICGIKEASDSLDRLIALSALGDRLHLWSGNDSAIFSTLSVGGLGVISVVSNLYPKETMEICKQFFANNRSNALKSQHALLPIINALFLETNPAPVKYAMSRAGLCSAEMRLPMWLPTAKNRKQIDIVMDEMAGE
ncbi:MAG: 4-hydroxy-tetrahydrodipicolinate synthase [Clostridia bacterium]|nr:4-hydroxy-tetrahydrodipicolinate synthase [Clostridia bacterium]